MDFISASLFPILLLISVYIPTPTCSSAIVPATIWTDTDGNPIKAHSGGFLNHQGFYYWFGEDKSHNRHTFHGINLYRSTDLVNWEFVSQAVKPTEENFMHLPSTEEVRGGELDEDEDDDVGAVCERPRVIYNERTRTFVMWIYVGTSDYELGYLGVLTSKRVEGPYKLIRRIRPLRRNVGDMTLWVDPTDKKAYIVYSRIKESQLTIDVDTIIEQLSPDYTDLKGIIHSFDGLNREGFALFKANGHFYLVSSGASGREHNQNTYMVANDLTGPWSKHYPLTPTSTTTYESKTSFVICLKGGHFVYAGDRWKEHHLGESRYIWLPIKFELPAKRIHVDWSDAWWVDTKTGRHGDVNPKPLKNGKITGGAVSQACTGCVGGTSITKLGKGGRIKFTTSLVNIPGRKGTLVISYSNVDPAPRQGKININGKFFKTFSFPSTGQVNNVKRIVFQIPIQGGRSNTVEFYNDKGKAPDLDYIKIL